MTTGRRLSTGIGNCRRSSRLVQEVARLGGHFAHVHDEVIDPKRDEAAGETWLHGRFSYMLYRRSEPSR
jgi:hypothetical protein